MSAPLAFLLYSGGLYLGLALLRQTWQRAHGRPTEIDPRTAWGAPLSRKWMEVAYCLVAAILVLGFLLVLPWLSTRRY